MHEKFGFQTRRLTVLKAYEEDAKYMRQIYLRQPNVPSLIDEKILRQCMREAENDLYQEVTFLIRDKANKLIGMVETKSEDKLRVEVSIWIPNEAKRVTYLKELVDSIIEWCGEYERYHSITRICLIKTISQFGATYAELRGEINLKCAS